MERKLAADGLASQSSISDKSLRWFADSLAGQVETMRSEEPLEVKDGDPFLMEVHEEWLMATDSLATVPDH